MSRTGLKVIITSLCLSLLLSVGACATGSVGTGWVLCGGGVVAAAVVPLSDPPPHAATTLSTSKAAEHRRKVVKRAGKVGVMRRPYRRPFHRPSTDRRWL